MAKELIITVKILIEAEEEELFEATDEDALIGQADMVKDFLRQPAQYGTLDWKLDTPFLISPKILQMMRGR